MEEASRRCSSPYLLMLVLALAQYWCAIAATASCTFTVSNYCSQPIWPATLAGAGTPQLPTTGFRLDPGQSVQVPAPAAWSGRVWARTGCVFDADGRGACQTGDCGGRMECAGAAATPPATLFEITLGKAGTAGAGAGAAGLDYYDVSLVDGYNLPVVAVPLPRPGGGAAGRCNATGCMADLNRSCPRELQVECGGGTVACRSACEAFGEDEYCCSGAYAAPTACRPTAYSSIFKSACPRAYSYAYDDSSSTFTCSGAAGYTIAFCLPPSGLHDSDGSVSAPASGQNAGGGSVDGADSTPPPPPAVGNGVGSSNQTPPSIDNGGDGTTGQQAPPAASDNGGGDGNTYLQPPPADDDGAGGGTYQQPWMTMSLASTLHEQLWLLPAVLLFFL